MEAPTAAFFVCLLVKKEKSAEQKKNATKRTFRRALDLLIPPFSRKFNFKARDKGPAAC